MFKVSPSMSIASRVVSPAESGVPPGPTLCTSGFSSACCVPRTTAGSASPPFSRTAKAVEMTSRGKLHACSTTGVTACAPGDTSSSTRSRSSSGGGSIDSRRSETVAGGRCCTVRRLFEHGAHRQPSPSCRSVPLATAARSMMRWANRQKCTWVLYNTWVSRTLWLFCQRTYVVVRRA